ncbi:MAG: sel1 repeat family protein [Synergistaceae bacterium]|nr:sel1 repeat family protein [Synergistaceae bacterium]
MKRISVLISACILAAVISTCAFGMSYTLRPESVTGINPGVIRELFARAMYRKDGENEPDPKAQYELGVIFYTMYEAANFKGAADYDEAKSYAVTYNLTQAAYWLKLAAERDYAPAQYLLGSFWHLHGMEAARMWMGRAAENGYARTQAMQANLFLAIAKAKRNMEDLNQAVDFAVKSAEQGDALGMYILSEIYGDEHFSVYDKAKANDWEKKAREAAENDPIIEFND